MHVNGENGANNLPDPAVRPLLFLYSLDLETNDCTPPFHLSTGSQTKQNTLFCNFSIQIEFVSFCRDRCPGFHGTLCWTTLFFSLLFDCSHPSVHRGWLTEVLFEKAKNGENIMKGVEGVLVKLMVCR